MIKTETVKIDFTNDNEVIEKALRVQAIEPLRWAVVAVEGSEMLVCVSFEC